MAVTIYIYIYIYIYISVSIFGGSARDVMTKVPENDIVVSEFALQSRYNIYFRTNTLGKDMSPLIS